jgi:predicted transcriptional regulator
MAMRSIVSVSLPPDLATTLEQLARSTGRTKSDILKESFAAYLWETQFRALQRYFIPKAKKAGILTEDDVFRAVS